MLFNDEPMSSTEDRQALLEEKIGFLQMEKIEEQVEEWDDRSVTSFSCDQSANDEILPKNEKHKSLSLQE